MDNKETESLNGLIKIFDKGEFAKLIPLCEKVKKGMTEDYISTIVDPAIRKRATTTLNNYHTDRHNFIKYKVPGSDAVLSTEVLNRRIDHIKNRLAISTKELINNGQYVEITDFDGLLFDPLFFDV